MLLALLVLATARATRFITQDWLGHWWIVEPARRWAVEPRWQSGHLPATWEDAVDLPDPPARVKLVKGLDCPFCVGFWIGVVALLSLAIARAVPPLLPIWKFFAGSLALNYIVGHVSSRIDG